jgi:hypothetical protein
MVTSGGTDAITLWDPGSIIVKIHTLVNLILDGGGSSVRLFLQSAALLERHNIINLDVIVQLGLAP